MLLRNTKAGVLLTSLVATGLLTTAASSYGAMTTPGLIAATDLASLRVDASGAVWGVGWNQSGQLGDGTFTNSVTWKKIPTLSKMKSVGGSNHASYALSQSGVLYAWGENGWGQRCSATLSKSATPAAILTNVIDYTASASFSAALKADGTVWYCGNLGGIDGIATNITAPKQISGLSDIVDISGGGANGYLTALRADGTVWVLGTNSYGLNGTATTFSATPIQVKDAAGVALTDVTSLAASRETGFFALQAGGTVKYVATSIISQPYGSNNVQARRSGLTTFAINALGETWSDGNNDYGQLGRGYIGCTPSCALGKMVLPNDVIEVTGGRDHVFAITSSGAIYAWGRNDFGQLGTGSTSTPKSTPTTLGTTTVPVSRPAAQGLTFSLAVGSSNVLRASGNNSRGQLGTGNITSLLSAANVVGLSGSTLAVAAGSSHSVSVQFGGTVWTWGDGTESQLGDGSPGRSSPGKIALSNIVDVATGPSHTLALSSDGRVYAWGKNTYGQIGNGSYIYSQLTPYQLALTNIVAIAAGQDFSMALAANGDVWAWGSNGVGQVGVGSLTNPAWFTTPQKVTVLGTNKAKAIAAGYLSAHVLTARGEIMGWGGNFYGQVGNGTKATTSLTAVKATGLTYATAVSVAYGTIHAATVGGAIYGWGENTQGSVGNGTTTAASTGVLTPVVVMTAPVNFTRFAKEGYAQHSMMRIGTTLYRTGRNTEGQLGIGNTTNQTRYVSSTF